MSSMNSNNDHKEDTITKKTCQVIKTISLISSEESDDEVNFHAVSRANSKARSVAVEDVSEEPCHKRKTRDTDCHISLNKRQAVLNLSASDTPHSQKIKSVVPFSLKSLIGKRPISRDDFLLLILEWNADWLTDLQENQDPPLIAHDLRTVLNTYENYDDYYNTFFPLMMLETWHRIYDTFTDFSKKLPLSCYITSYTVKRYCTEVECKAVYKSGMIFPHVGKIIVVRYTMKSTNQTIKVFGYVTEAKVKEINPVTDTVNIEFLTKKMGTIFLKFISIYHIEDINEDHPLDMKILCSVDFNLKQNDALLFIKNCPLQRSIVDPVENGFLSFSLSGEHSSEDDVKECAWNILKNILSPNPAPIIAVRTDIQFAHSKVIPLVVQAIKKDCNKVKVLICVRHLQTLWEVAHNLSSLKNLDFVIFHKCADTSSKFHKFTLDKIAESKEKIKQIGEQKISKENILKIKKDILLSSDVVLSLIKCSHDKFLAETILEIKSIHKICCIIDEANYCTEPETLIPTLLEIDQLILVGDLEEKARLHSKTACAYNFNQSFFQRAYETHLINRSKSCSQSYQYLPHMT